MCLVDDGDGESVVEQGRERKWTGRPQSIVPNSVAKDATARTSDHVVLTSPVCPRVQAIYCCKQTTPLIQFSFLRGCAELIRFHPVQEQCTTVRKGQNVTSGKMLERCTPIAIQGRFASIVSDLTAHI
jgi:hypothetical protein